MLAIARKKVPSAVWIKGSASLGGMSEVQEASVSLAVSVNSFHFWPNPLAGLNEIQRKLKPGGRLVLTDWSNDFWWCKLLGWWLWIRGCPGSTFYDCASTVKMLEAAGFHNVRGELFLARGWGMFCVMGEMPIPKE